MANNNDQTNKLYKMNSIKNCDRFIPLRLSSIEKQFDECEENIDEILKNNINTTHSLISFVNIAKIRYRQYNYQNLLRSTLFPIEYRTLNFFPPKKRTTIKPFFDHQQSWPVKARNKPIIGPPSCVLDMPQIGTTTSCIMDWSSTDWLAVIFENEVHMCSYQKSNKRIVTRTNKTVDNYVKWNDAGDRLAITLKWARLGIWDLSTNKIVHETVFCCPIICIRWYNNYLIILSADGFVRITNQYLHTVHIKRLKHKDVGIIEMSCKKNYAVTVGNSRTIKIWLFPSFVKFGQIKTSSIVRSVAWHPWKETLLVVGNKKLSLWNIERNEKLCEEDEKTISEDRIIDTLMFNPKSAELVMNFRTTKHNDSTTTERSIIGVLPNINFLIEELYLQWGRILHLLWGPGYNTLASAGSDENICFWDFFNGQNVNDLHNNQIRTNEVRRDRF